MVASQRCPSGEEHALHFCTLTRRIHVALPAVHGRVVERREACTADRGGGLAVPSARGPLHSLGSQTARHACRQIGGAAYQPPELTVEGGPHAVVRVFEQPQRLQHQHRLDCHQAATGGLAVTQRGATDVAARKRGAAHWFESDSCTRSTSGKVWLSFDSEVPPSSAAVQSHNQSHLSHSQGIVIKLVFWISKCTLVQRLLHRQHTVPRHALLPWMGRQQVSSQVRSTSTN